jgi:hypothetical protein
MEERRGKTEGAIMNREEVSAVLARQDEPLPEFGKRKDFFRLARQGLKTQDRAAYSRSE